MRTSSVFESELSSWWAGQGQEETTSSSILDRVVVFDDASKKEEKVIMEREESGKMVLDPERDERERERLEGASWSLYLSFEELEEREL